MKENTIIEKIYYILGFCVPVINRKLVSKEKIHNNKYLYGLNGIFFIGKPILTLEFTNRVNRCVFCKIDIFDTNKVVYVFINLYGITKKTNKFIFPIFKKFWNQVV